MDGKKENGEYARFKIPASNYGEYGTLRNSGSFKIFEIIQAISFTSCDVSRPLRGSLGHLSGTSLGNKIKPGIFLGESVSSAMSNFD